MSLNKKVWISAGMIALLLAGCGSDESKVKVSNGSEKKTVEETASADNKVNKKKPAEEQPGSNDETVRILEQNLTYNVNGEAKEATAHLKYNDNQSYSMYVLPDYELTSEEPGKDVLFLDSDDSVFMRIEVLPPDSDWNMVSETTKEQVAYLDSEGKNMEMPEDEFFKNGTGFESMKDGEMVSAYLINNEELKLRLTMFTKSDADHRKAFEEMAKTIKLEKKY